MIINQLINQLINYADSFLFYHGRAEAVVAVVVVAAAATLE